MKTFELDNQYYLMRHGQSIANKEGLIVSKPHNAMNGYGLTTKGAEQVLNAALNTRLGRNIVIVSSDYKRAIETANIMHSVLGVTEPVLLEPLLRERDFGNWELTEHDNYDKVWEEDLNNPTQATNNVETVSQTLTRGLNAIEKLEDQYKGKKILLVGHGDVLQILCAHHHDINARFHRSLNSIANADIRSLTQAATMQKTILSPNQPQALGA